MTHSVFVLLIVLFTKDGPANIDKVYENRFDCEVSEGLILTKARNEPLVLGWVVPVECTEITEVKKV